MAQFDVYRSRGDQPYVPFFLDIQSDFLSSLRTRVVVPLVPVDLAWSSIDRLQPSFEVEGRRYVMMTSELAGVGLQDLGEVVASLDTQRDAIVGALDFLLYGF